MSAPVSALVTALAAGSTTGWTVGYVVTIVVVLVVVALVVPILLLAHRIGGQAATIDASLQESVAHTAALRELHTTIDDVTEIVGGLHRGRTRLGG